MKYIIFLLSLFTLFSSTVIASDDFRITGTIYSQSDNTSKIIINSREYSLDNETIILCDPMLASGSSMILAMEAIMSKGNPKHIHIVAIIASAEGVDYVKENIPMQNCTLWLGGEDAEMTAQSYIVPGLGDAGDLAFGEKI